MIPQVATVFRRAELASAIGKLLTERGLSKEQALVASYAAVEALLRIHRKHRGNK